MRYQVKERYARRGQGVRVQGSMSMRWTEYGRVVSGIRLRREDEVVVDEMEWSKMASMRTRSGGNGD